MPKLTEVDHTRARRFAREAAPLSASPEVAHLGRAYLAAVADVERLAIQLGGVVERIDQALGKEERTG